MQNDEKTTFRIENTILKSFSYADFFHSVAVAGAPGPADPAGADLLALPHHQQELSV